MSVSPLVARRRLGAALRELRTSAGVRIEDAARELECSTAKVSRLETGKGVPRTRDVRDLIDFYGDAARARKDELLSLVADSLREGRLISDFRDVVDGEMMSADQIRFMGLEQDATALSLYQSGLVPGLLQTEAYAYAVAQLFFPDQDETQRKRFVELRLQRQEVLRRRPDDRRLQLAVVLGEPVFRRPVGGAGVMRDQVRHLLAELRNGLSDIEFRVAPLTLVTPAVLGGPFSIMEFASSGDQDVVYLEGTESATYLETDDQVRRYKSKFASLITMCPDRDSSLEIVEEAATTLR